MTQDEVFARVKNFAVRHSIFIANPITERLSPVAGAFSLALGYATGGKVPRSHENLLAGANAVATARGKNEHPNIIAWKTASNQLRNDFLGLRILTRNATMGRVAFDLPPETKALKDSQTSFFIVAMHSLAEISLLPEMNKQLANNNGVIFAVADQPDLLMQKMKEKATESGLTVAKTENALEFIRQCRRTIQDGGVVSVIEGTRPNQAEQMIEVNFLGERVLLREGIYKLASSLKVPLIPAMSTVEKGQVKVLAGRPIATIGRKPQEIAQDWADSMSELTKRYPTSNLAFFELQFVARR